MELFFKSLYNVKRNQAIINEEEELIMIESYSFGTITIAGRSYRNDVRIIDGRVVPEWWRREGHLCTLDDLQEVVAAAPDILVLGTGASGRMRPQAGLEDELARRGIACEVLPTREAVDRFNHLHEQGESVAAALHLTC